MRRFVDFIAPALPYRLAASLDHFTNHKKFYYPFGGPVNGSTARAEVIRELIEFCGIERIVETGTFRGTTTEWFSSFGLPVISYEIMPRYAEFARMRLRKRENVTVVTAESSEGLEALVSSGADLDTPTLFYLAAHWYDYLPLRREYEMICENFPRPIIVVDDFKVEGDPDYAFSSYEVGTLDLDYMVKPDDDFPARIYFPSTPACWETGAKTGYVAITTDDVMARIIEERIPLLRRYDLPAA